MLLQMLVIFFLSSWIYEEYLNNIYLQSYVNDVIQADGSLIAIVVIVSTLGLAMGLLRVLKSTHREIGAIVNQPQAPAVTPSMSSSKPMVDLHPMVAALRADRKQRRSRDPPPPLTVKEAAPQPVPVQAPQNP